MVFEIAPRFKLKTTPVKVTTTYVMVTVYKVNATNPTNSLLTGYRVHDIFSSRYSWRYSFPNHISIQQNTVSPEMVRKNRREFRHVLHDNNVMPIPPASIHGNIVIRFLK
jgi:hypothetical protein